MIFNFSAKNINNLTKRKAKEKYKRIIKEIKRAILENAESCQYSAYIGDFFLSCENKEKFLEKYKSVVDYFLNLGYDFKYNFGNHLPTFDVIIEWKDDIDAPLGGY